jgi:hypothetical protein
MAEVIISAYTWLDVNDPRYEDNPRWIRSDTLKAINQLVALFRKYGDEGEVRQVDIYPSKGKVNLKLRLPPDYSGRNVSRDITDKEGIYETVLGMVMDGHN